MKLLDLEQYLTQHTYPGRGIVLGRTPDNDKVAVAYFIMGRSENSRNRIFEETEDGIRTNGDQTDTIRDHIQQGHCYRHALNTRAFEPDGPNFTPRISGVVKPDCTYNLSILKSLDGDPDCCCRYFFEYDHAAPGVGHFIHTYQEDVNPLPSFEGEPRRVAIPQLSAQEWAKKLWASLNEDNKVSLYVSMIDVRTGSRDSVIINKHN